jgi:N-acetylglucosamine malate deacetylase 1
MIDQYKNVLVLAPHADDGELGCGGTISKLIEYGSVVHYMAFSIASESLIQMGLPGDTLKKEVRSATKKLGIKDKNLQIFDYQVRKLSYRRQELLEDMIYYRNNNNIDLVLMPCLHDIHQDHSIVSLEGLRAFKNISILGYELMWNNMKFDTTCFIDLDKKHMDLKIKSLEEYKSQRGRAYMDKDFIFSLAKSRGVQIGVKYSECFEVIRLVLK